MGQTPSTVGFSMQAVVGELGLGAPGDAQRCLWSFALRVGCCLLVTCSLPAFLILLCLKRFPFPEAVHVHLDLF